VRGQLVGDERDLPRLPGSLFPRSGRRSGRGSLEHWSGTNDVGHKRYVYHQPAAGISNGICSADDEVANASCSADEEVANGSFSADDEVANDRYSAEDPGRTYGRRGSLKQHAGGRGTVGCPLRSPGNKLRVLAGGVDEEQLLFVPFS